MSIASRIQEIETHIGNAYTSIDNLGIDISNTNKNIYNISTLLDTFYESLPKVSGIGASLSLSPSMVGKIKLNEIQGDTLQDGTPTPDTPVPIQSVTGLQNVSITGKNLFDKDGLTSAVTIDGTKITMLRSSGWATNKVLLSNIIKAGTILTASRSEYSTTNNADISIQLFKGETSVAYFNLKNESNTQTLANDVDSYRLTISYNASGDTTGYVKDVQLEKGSTATTYEPYKGNTYEVNLGKNLFDSDLIIPNIISKAGRPNAFSYDSSTKELTMTNYSADTYLPGIWGDANYIEGINIKVHPNTTYTLSFDINQPKSTLKNGIMGLNKQTNKYRYISNGLMQENLFTFNTGEYDTITIRLGSTAETGTVTIFSNFQLERGETQTSYSEYFLPYELNDEDSIKKSTGKQLFDKDNANVLNGNLADGGTLSSTNNARTLYIPCKNNTTYTISKLQAVYFRVAQFTNVPQIGDSYISRTKDDLANSITFTTTTGNYLAVTYWYNTSTYTEQQILDSIMINEGSTALLYEPYGKVWYVEKQTYSQIIGNVSTTNARTRSNTSTTHSKFYIINSLNYDCASQTSLISDYFPTSGGANAQAYSDNAICSNASSGYQKYLYFSIPNEIASTIEQFISYINSTGIKVVYQLATPIYEVITNTELIEQLESLNNAKSKDGTTNINVTSEDLSMILNVGVLKGE